MSHVVKLTPTDSLLFKPVTITVNAKAALEACNNCVKDIYEYRRVILEGIIKLEMERPIPVPEKWWQFHKKKELAPAKTWVEAYDRLDSDGDPLTMFDITLPSTIDKIKQVFETERLVCLQTMIDAEKNIESNIVIHMEDYCIFANYLLA